MQRETYRRDLPGQCNLLRNGPLAFLDRAVEVYIRDLFAEIGLRVDELDQAVLDLKNDVRALGDVFEEGAHGFDGEVAAPAETRVVSSNRATARIYEGGRIRTTPDLLLRRVGTEINVVYDEEVVVVLGLAVGKWAVTGDRNTLARQRLLA